MPSLVGSEMCIRDSSHDLACRYAEGENDAQGHVKKRYYQGQKYISQIEDFATDIMKSLFKSTWADVRLVSGTHANLATFKGCLLYTSDAADDLLCVDLGGRRII